MRRLLMRPWTDLEVNTLRAMLAKNALVWRIATNCSVQSLPSDPRCIRFASPTTGDAVTLRKLRRVLYSNSAKAGAIP
jgi:hypothetical protein